MSSKIIALLLAFLALWSTVVAVPLPTADPDTSENPAAILTRQIRYYRLECMTRRDGSQAMSAANCWRRFGTWCDENGRMVSMATLYASHGTGDCSSVYRNCYCDAPPPAQICSYQLLAISQCRLENGTVSWDISAPPNTTLAPNATLAPSPSLTPNFTLAPNASLIPSTSLTPSTTLTPNTTSSSPNSTVSPSKSAGDTVGMLSPFLVTVLEALLIAVAFGYVI